jgi:(p)ppGpp synthase/HD superfamily hydrolase
VLSARFEEALAFAARLHREQVRKGSGIPYVAHLLATTALALENGADEDEAIAALLHDAVEDQGGPVVRAEIERRFGSRVAAIVDECSDTDQDPKPPWRERKDAYLAHLESASRSALLVTACDKLHNARSVLQDFDRLGESLWERFSGGREGTLWYYRSVADALARVFDSPVVAELENTVAELEDRARRGEAAD